MKTKNLAIYQGDSYLFKVALTDEKGEPLQTDGLSFALSVKFPDGETITPELTVDGNIVSLLFPSALTAAITHQTAEYDLRAISGQYVKTYLRGQLHITPSITPVTVGDGGEIREEAVSVAVSEAAIIRAAGNQSQTAYDDSEIKQRLAALEGRQDRDTVYDDSDLKQRLAALENRQDQDTVFDDSELKRRLAALENRQDRDTVYDDSEIKQRLTALENRPAPVAKAESPYSEIQEGYIARENFGFDPSPMKMNTVYFPTPFSRRPDIFEAYLDIRSNSTRWQYIQNVTESGFDITTTYPPDLKGVWYRAAILKSQ
nr:MAG TPA: BppU domain protein [Caudoviricetes sp.]